MSELPTHHDLFITTPTIARTSIFNLPFRVVVHCRRVSGWEVWANEEGGLKEELLGGEYSSDKPLRLDVAGHVICQTDGAEF